MPSKPDSRSKTIPMADTAAATEPPPVSPVGQEQPADPVEPVGIPEINHWALHTGPAQLGLTLRTVLREIALFANKEGYANPSQDTLAARLECSRLTITRAVNALEAFEVLTIEKIPRENDYPYNRYWFADRHTDWVPEAKDMEESPTLMGAFRAVQKAKDRKIAESEHQMVAKDSHIAELCDMVIRMSRGEEVNVSESYLRSLVVVSPGQYIDQELTTTTNLSVSLSDPAPSKVSESYLAPPRVDPPAIDAPPPETPASRLGLTEEEYNRRLAEVTGWTESNFYRLSWENLPPAISYYMENYDTAPPGKQSFLEQKETKAKEDRLKTPPGGNGNDRDKYLNAYQRRKQTNKTGIDQKYVDDYILRFGESPFNATHEGNPEHLTLPHTASPEAQGIWTAVLGELQIQLPRSAFQTWLKHTEGHFMDETRFVVSAPTTFAVQWLERRMYNAIQKTVEKVTEQPLEVHFIVKTSPEADAGGNADDT